MKALQEPGYRIGDLCAAFGVARSGYHRWRTAEPSARAGKDAQLAGHCTGRVAAPMAGRG